MKVKICGITNPDDAECAVACGADFIGFVFCPISPRCVSLATVRGMVSALPAAVEKVGVFVDETNETMLAAARECGLTMLQLHGREPVAQVRQLPPSQVLLAVALGGTEDLELLEQRRDWLLLVDTPTPQHGGSGRTGDWDLARQAAARHRILLAGGLTPDNVAAAVRHVRPWGVDVSSGVEAKPGRKDPERVRAFIASARAAAAASDTGGRSA